MFFSYLLFFFFHIRTSINITLNLCSRVTDQQFEFYSTHSLFTNQMGYRRMGALQQILWEDRVSSAVCALHPAPARQHKSLCPHQVLQQRPPRGQEALQQGAVPSTVENRTLVTGQSLSGGLKQLQ